MYLCTGLCKITHFSIEFRPLGPHYLPHPLQNLKSSRAPPPPHARRCHHAAFCFSVHGLIRTFVFKRSKLLQFCSFRRHVLNVPRPTLSLLLLPPLRCLPNAPLLPLHPTPTSSPRVPLSALSRHLLSLEYLFTGNAAFSKQSFSVAEACYSRASVLEPKQPLALSNRALAVMNQGRSEEALKVFPFFHELIQHFQTTLCDAWLKLCPCSCSTARSRLTTSQLTRTTRSAACCTIWVIVIT